MVNRLKYKGFFIGFCSCPTTSKNQVIPLVKISSIAIDRFLCSSYKFKAQRNKLFTLDPTFEFDPVFHFWEVSWACPSFQQEMKKWFAIAKQGFLFAVVGTSGPRALRANPGGTT